MILPGLLALTLAGSAPAGFVEVGTHPDAAAQPTPLGRMLATLVGWNGRLYAGYGDFVANTGPIAITPYDPTSGEFVREGVSDTEAIYIYRAFGERLFAPAIDRKFEADYAVGLPWEDVHVTGTSHAFDMASLGGDDLWLVGSLGVYARAWRSRDGGLTWSESLRMAPARRARLARFYFAGVHQGRLYVQAAPRHRRSMVFDGRHWRPGPDLLLGGAGHGWHPVTFAHRMVYQTGTPHAGEGSQLLAFDGAAVQTVLPDPIRDFAVGAAGLFTLALDGQVRCTLDLARWRPVGQAPAGAMTIGLLEGDVYVGTADSRLFRLSLPPRTGCAVGPAGAPATE